MMTHNSSLSRVRESLPILLVVGSGLAFAFGAALQNPGLLGGGAVALCATWREWRRWVPSRRVSDAPACQPEQVSCATPATPVREDVQLKPRRTAKKDTAADLVEEMIETGRYALLLHTDTASHIDDAERDKVVDVMEQAMSIVPEGHVLVGVSAERATWSGAATCATVDGVQAVKGFYIDRYAVTNEEFQHFVDAGVYDDMTLWPEEALPALFEFVDQTGEAGPRHWSNGQHDPATARLPVVGVSWYEACAYARWVGKRLLTDAEWTKAAAWPVETTPGRITQRRYPWGDSFESRRANLWNSGVGRPSAVDHYPDGATLGGVYQLIGNVWEWTCDEFVEGTDAHGGGESLRTLHGGAFNTYFENQATCHFRSGEAPLARRGNIGFRLALSIDELDIFDEE